MTENSEFEGEQVVPMNSEASESTTGMSEGSVPAGPAEGARIDDTVPNAPANDSTTPELGEPLAGSTDWTSEGGFHWAGGPAFTEEASQGAASEAAGPSPRQQRSERRAAAAQAKRQKPAVLTMGKVFAMTTITSTLVASAIGGFVGYHFAHSNTTVIQSPVVSTASSQTSLSGNSAPLNIQQILGKVDPAVVDITTSGFTQSGGFFGGTTQFQAAGTGMIISSNGDVLTNDHVIANATSIKVTLYGQTKSYPAKVLGADPAHDVAVIQIQGLSGLPTVTFGNSANVKVGDPVVAIGNALALQGLPTVTQGIVSGLNRSISTQTANLTAMIQTDAPINPGNSGGPLLNAAGNVIGMNTAILTGNGQEVAQNIGFAESINSVLSIVRQIQAHPTTGTTTLSPVSNRAYMGVSVETMSPALDNQLGYSTSVAGALVDYVVPNSPAQQVGLVPGDVITALDNKSVNSASALVSIVKSLKPSDQVPISWVGVNGPSNGIIQLAAAPSA